MSEPSERVKGILSRILSQEVAHQEIWRDKERARFGYDKIDRDGIIEEIKQYMMDNDIDFNNEFYIQEF